MWIAIALLNFCAYGMLFGCMPTRRARAAFAQKQKRKLRHNAAARIVNMGQRRGRKRTLLFPSQELHQDKYNVAGIDTQAPCMHFLC